MLSQMESLFRTTLRQAERTDTRLEIRRDESPPDQRKSRQRPEEDEPSALWNDSTSVSIPALKAFLVEFLHSHGHTSDADRTQTSITEASHTPTYASTVAARAAKAYGSVQNSVSEHVTAPQNNLVVEEPINLADLLAADEIRTIHLLIKELDHLSGLGIETLSIEKADTFLESLVFAVTRQKSNL